MTVEQIAAKLQVHMARLTVKHVTIIGAGLLGGSLGLALKRRCPWVHVAGVGRRESSLQEAMARGAIDSAHLDVVEPAGRSDLIVLATPVGAFEHYLRAIKPCLRDRAVVTDVGSTKLAVVRAAARILGPAGPFVASHPMAGSELKGANHARADLFEGAVCILTPTARTPAWALGQVRRLWRAVGCRLVRMTPSGHDGALARVSHLPHAISALLTMLPDGADLKVAGPGLRDMTRLAGGDAEIWRDIFMTNRACLLEAIDRLDEDLMHLRDLLEAGDAKGIQRLLELARRCRAQRINQSGPSGADPRR